MKNLRWAFFAIFSVILTACSQMQIDTASETVVPERFEQAEAAKGSDEIRQWWRNWNDPQLTALIEKGLSHNLDIKLARARLSEAQANSDYAEADRGINISASGSAVGGTSDLNTGTINPGRSRSAGAYGGINAAWEPDFFGRKRSDADAAQAAALSAQEQVYAAQLLVSSEIADNYFRIHALEQQDGVVDKNIKTMQELQRYVVGRFNAGQTTAYEVNEIATQITALQAKRATLKAQADVFQRNIAILTGAAPQGFRLEKRGNPLAKIPAAPSGQFPAAVIERRPDIRAHAQQIRASAAKWASAKADLYPRFDISFMGQGGRIELNNDLSHISGISGLAGLDVQLPIFTNGRIQANIDAADARVKAALIQYDKTLLTALGEVDSAYQTQYSLENRTRLLQKSYTQAQKQANDAKILFTHDDKTLDVAIRARSAALNYQEQIIQSQLARAQNLIGLYKALGGGWSK